MGPGESTIWADILGHHTLGYDIKVNFAYAGLERGRGRVGNGARMACTQSTVEQAPEQRELGEETALKPYHFELALCMRDESKTCCNHTPATVLWVHQRWLTNPINLR